MLTFEPQHDIANKVTYAPNEDSDESGHPDQSSLCAQWVAKASVTLRLRPRCNLFATISLQLTGDR